MWHLLTRSRWFISPAVQGAPACKVYVAVIRPETAVEEALDISEPVREPRDTWGLSVGRGAHFLCSIWAAAASRVPGQDLGPGFVVATLLP